MKLRAGDLVEVRSKEEILRSLDCDGRFEGLPFMPQMFQYCGQRFPVYKRAHKTCDTVTFTGTRRLANAVHLTTRCDGESHGGCQAACLLFWKDIWLKRVDGEGSAAGGDSVAAAPKRGDEPRTGCCSEALILSAACSKDVAGEALYACQATLLPSYTAQLRWWDLRQYLEDYSSGNVTLGRLLSGFAYAGYYQLVKNRYRSVIPLHWLYDKFQALIGGSPYPNRTGKVPAGQRTPSCDLNLQPGELVRIKSYPQILETLDEENYNRGMKFDVEQVYYCGGTYRVKARVTTFIDEPSGKMTSMKTPAIMLENVWCESRYSQCRMLCPRSIYSWWREVWLERIPEGSTKPGSADKLLEG